MYIAKQEFKHIIEDETSKDLDVRDAIDKLFEPLNIFKNESANYNTVDKDSPSTNDKGMAKTKTLPAFKNSNNNDVQSN